MPHTTWPARTIFELSTPQPEPIKKPVVVDPTIVIDCPTTSTATNLADTNVAVATTTDMTPDAGGTPEILSFTNGTVTKFVTLDGTNVTTANIVNSITLTNSGTKNKFVSNLVATKTQKWYSGWPPESDEIH